MTYLVDHLLAGPHLHIRQLILRRFVKFVQGLVSSTNPIISALAYWGVQTRQSVTGKNVANIREEFKMDPLKCKPWALNVKKKEVSEQGDENIQLLETLLSIRAVELEPDILTELNGLIDIICAQ